MTNKLQESDKVQLATCSNCGKIDSSRKMAWHWQLIEYGGPNLFKGVFCDECQKRGAHLEFKEPFKDTNYSVSAVEEKDKAQVALEELKKQLSYIKNQNGFMLSSIDLENLRDKAQNLVDALEEQKVTEREILPENDIKNDENLPNGKPESIWKCTCGKILPKNHDSAFCSEECCLRMWNNQEPLKHIWKPVSEEIDNQSIIFINKAGYARLAEYWNDKIYFIDGIAGGSGEEVRAITINKNYYVEKYCTLTDFINEHENLKSRVEKLEKIMEGK